MDFDDVALCYLFMQAGEGDEKEKTAKFNELEKVVKLPDLESNRLSEFKKEFKKKEVAQKKFQRCCLSMQKNTHHHLLFHSL